MNSIVKLTSDNQQNFLLVEVNEGVIAPYVVSDLATFYEACFVQKNTENPLITLATTLLTINEYTGTNLIPNPICKDKTNTHPIIVKLNFPDISPALSTDSYTLEIEAEFDQNLGIETDIPAYLSQGDVTVTYDNTNNLYSITDWPTDMSIYDTWVLYLPSAYCSDSNYYLKAYLKYPDSTFSTVDHVFYSATE